MKTNELGQLLAKLKNGYVMGGVVMPYSETDSAPEDPALSNVDQQILKQITQPEAVDTPTPKPTYDPQAEIDTEIARQKARLEAAGFGEAQLAKIQRDKLNRMTGADPKQLGGADWEYLANFRNNPEYIKARNTNIDEETTGGYNRRLKSFEEGESKATQSIVQRQELMTKKLAADLIRDANDPNSEYSKNMYQLSSAWLERAGVPNWQGILREGMSGTQIEKATAMYKDLVEQQNKLKQDAANNEAQRIREKYKADTEAESKRSQLAQERSEGALNRGATLTAARENRVAETAKADAQAGRAAATNEQVIKAQKFLGGYVSGLMTLDNLKETADKALSEYNAINYVKGIVAPYASSDAGNWLTNYNSIVSNIMADYPQSLINSDAGMTNIQNSIGKTGLSKEEMIKNLDLLRNRMGAGYDQSISTITGAQGKLPDVPIPRDLRRKPEADRTPQGQAKAKVEANKPAYSGQVEPQGRSAGQKEPTVPMKNAQGKIYDIPQSQVEAAIARGFVK